MTPGLAGIPLPAGGKRVEALINKAFEEGFADDTPLQDLADDFILAAAVLMVLVHRTMPGTELCPPMSGRPEIDEARHAISKVAANMINRKEEAAS
jgi:hypothetical protein